MRNITRRRCSFIFGALAAALFMVLAILCFTAKDGTGVGLFFTAVAVMSFTFVSCLFLGNNFIGETVASIFEWGFVQMPGVIFTLDLDGLIWLLTVKLLFWILGIILALLCGLLGVVIGAVLSLFVYPFAIVKNFKGNPNEVIDE